MSNVDWSKAPDWAQYWAMDLDGDSFWYESAPELDVADGVWSTIKQESFGSEIRNVFAPAFGVDKKDWKESLSGRWQYRKKGE